MSVKNVGIGYYDPSLLDYGINEGPRSRWLTGEIFVAEGLEDALNIDRDSFNRFHPEFKYLQQFVHSILQEKIFPKVYKKIDERSLEKQEKKAVERRELLADVVKESADARLKLIRGGPDAVVSAAKRTDRTIEVPISDAADLRTANRSRELARAILVLYEVANLERDKGRQRERFVELLLGLLRDW